MKALLFLIGMLGAGLIGFSFEPSMRKQLTGKEPGRLVGKNDKLLARSSPLVVDLASWPADRLPEKVGLKTAAEVTSKTDGLKMTVPAGNRVNLVRLDGNKVVISPGGDVFEGVVLVSETDLVEQVAALAKSSPVVSVEPSKPEVAAMPEPEIAVVQPAVVPQPEAPVVPEVAPEVVVTPEPEEAPEPVAPEPISPPVASAGSGDVVAIMQASIRSGEIQEFTFDQVLDWQANPGEEVVDGASYQTGLLSYKAETVFGVKTIQAKALIQNGKVVKWLWPKSGMVIK